MRNVLDKHTVIAFSKPAFNPAKVWTAVKKDFFFSGSFDFATFEEARAYIVSQFERTGYAVAHATRKDESAPEFRGTFIINRETFQTWTLADLNIAFERSNSWRSSRNVCLTASEHASRMKRINAYLAKRKARADIPMEFDAFKASRVSASDLPAALGMTIDEIGYETGFVFAGAWYIGLTATEYHLPISNMQWSAMVGDSAGLESLTWRLYGEYLSNFSGTDEARETAERMANNTAMLFHKEFPDYPVADMPTIPEGFEDTSWHNDSCPSFIHRKDGLIVFTDFADKNLREFSDDEIKRFSLSTYSDETGPITTLCYSDDWQDVLAVIIGRKFASVLREWLSAEQFAEMQHLNASETDSDICHSHDFCDANVAMIVAFTEYYLKCDPADQAQADLWNAAWNYAKREYLTAPAVAETVTLKPASEMAQAIWDLNGYGETLEARDEMRRLAMFDMIQDSDIKDPSYWLQVSQELEKLISQLPHKG